MKRGAQVVVVGSEARRVPLATFSVVVVVVGVVVVVVVATDGKNVINKD